MPRADKDEEGYRTHVRLPLYLKRSGESSTTFYRLIEEGVILEGVHYYRDPRNRVWVNTENMNSWIEGKKVIPSPRGSKRVKPKAVRHSASP